MGLFLSRLSDLFEHFTSGDTARILMLGLDAAGTCHRYTELLSLINGIC